MKLTLKQKLVFAVFVAFFLSFYAFASSLRTPDEYADYLAKTVDDVVKSIHATVPGSLITHSDVLTIMCIEQRSLRVGVTNSVGAKGLTQVMPATFNSYVKNNIQGFAQFAKSTGCNVQKLSSDVRCSIEAGARIFNHLLSMFNGDRTKAAIAYNGGPGRAKSMRLPEETRNYAYRLFPACQKSIINGNGPVSGGSTIARIWQRLVSKTKQIAGNAFFDPRAVVAQFVPYVSGANPDMKSIFGGKESFFDKIKKMFFGKSGSSSGSAGSSSSAQSKSSNTSNSSPSTRSPENYKPLDLSGLLESGSRASDTSGNLNVSNFDKKQANIKTGMLCIPSVLEKNEPYLLLYSCAGSDVYLDGKKLSDTQGVFVKTLLKDSKHKFVCKTENKSYESVCELKLIDPKVEVFKLDFQEIVPGSFVTITLKTRDMKSCEIFSINNGFKTSSTNGEFKFKVNFLPDRVKLKCKTKNNLQIEKEIDIIEK